MRQETSDNNDYISPNEISVTVGASHALKQIKLVSFQRTAISCRTRYPKHFMIQCILAKKMQIPRF